MPDQQIVDLDEWTAARNELLVLEKELTRRSDELAVRRQELPWVLIDNEYVLQTADGPRTLAQLFDGRSQLVMYNFMFGPDYEAGCPSARRSPTASTGCSSTSKPGTSR